ncbi:DUF115 domain-containing protein [Marinobacterium sp. D7]|uniref:motility associated factor glycosyltransferase family protein n=1 Tax=Marinobacterium ramblicola TaxID=2849041 RepID=UPI001C2DC931|nr:6-hydroxymethylpterin diphosphokinase MptE-like protein [Marinobacterium ramblicola]MBV1788869.1 DUF115 domain-containing protein [Marinobacterium ramblicola]
MDINSTEARTVLGDTPETVLVHSGLHISSAFDPEREANLQAARVPVESSTVSVYGVGSGYLVQTLLERPQVRKLNLVFFSYQLLAESMATYPHRWIEDPRVELQFGGSVKYPQLPFAAVYAELMSAEPDALPLRDRVLTELNEEFRRAGLARHYAKFERPNLINNRKNMISDPDVASLFGVASGGCVTVVAGGPSADYFLDNMVESDFLIVVSTALKGVLNRGLKPDVVVAIDGHKELLRHFDTVGPYCKQLNKAILAYAPVIQPFIVDSWPGFRCAFYLENTLFSEIRKQVLRSVLFCSGTVTHCAVDLAVKMGAEEVRLVGADFGFPGGFSHAEQTDHRQQQVGETQVMSGAGVLIDSTPALVGYLRDLEAYIELNPDVRFVQMSNLGAAIAGAKIFDWNSICET